MRVTCMVHWVSLIIRLNVHCQVGLKVQEQETLRESMEFRQ